MSLVSPFLQGDELSVLVLALLDDLLVVEHLGEGHVLLLEEGRQVRRDARVVGPKHRRHEEVNEKTMRMTRWTSVTGIRATRAQTRTEARSDDGKTSIPNGRGGAGQRTNDNSAGGPEK